MAAYDLFMGRRVAELHRVLKPQGSIYLHCDDAASHYLRVLMDCVFGTHNMMNVLTWRRATAHNDPSRYGRNTDHILFYSKSSEMYWNGGAAAMPKTPEELAVAYPSQDQRGNTVLLI